MISLCWLEALQLNIRCNGKVFELKKKVAAAVPTREFRHSKLICPWMKTLF